MLRWIRAVINLQLSKVHSYLEFNVGLGASHSYDAPDDMLTAGARGPQRSSLRGPRAHDRGQLQAVTAESRLARLRVWRIVIFKTAPSQIVGRNMHIT